MAGLGPRSGGGAVGVGLAFLAVASGSSDVIAFLVLGSVFTSAMTGNTALFGIAVSEGSWVAASYPLSALLGFTLGAGLGAVICDPEGTAGRPSSGLRTLLWIELLVLCGFAAVWHTVHRPFDGAGVYVLILLSAVGMGMQGIAARRLNAPGVNTIVFTSTLVAIVASVAGVLLRRSDSPALRLAARRQVAIFAAYVVGTVLAGVLFHREFGLLPWLPIAGVVGALVGCWCEGPPPAERNDA